MKKILITAIGGDIGYGIIKALKRSRHNLYIIGCDIKKYNCSYDLVDEFYVSPAYKKEDEWWGFIQGLVTDRKIDYFWPVTEPEIKIINRRREELHNVKVIINNPLILDIAMDKGETAKQLKKNGICTPRIWENVEDCFGKYPLIVKEKFSCGSHGIKVVNNKNELIDALGHMHAPIIQEYIGSENDEYTLAVFSDGYVVNYIAFKRELGFGGMSRFVELIYDEKIEEIAYRIAEILELRGSINIQMRKQEGAYYVFEINPRISSTVGFRLLLGFNDVSWWLDMAEGKKVMQYGYPSGKIYGVRSVEEKLFFEEEREPSIIDVKS